MKKITAEKALQRARSGLILRQPFLATIMMSLKLQSAAKRANGAVFTDGESIYFDPEWVLETYQESSQALMGAIASMTLKVALLHHTRRGERDQSRWINASSYVANGIVEQLGLELPENALRNEHFAGMPVEQVYNLLPDPQDSDDDCQQQSFGGDSQGQGSGNSQGDQQNQQDQPQNQGAQGWGAVADYPGPQEDGQGPSKEEIAAHEQETTERLAQGEAISKAQGNLPDCLKRLVDEATKPQHDWKDRLRSLAQVLSKEDYSWRHPDMRFRRMGCMLPGLHSEKLGTVVVVNDTSGSQGPAELAAGAAETSSILEDCKPERILVIDCDAAVQSVKELDEDDLPLDLAFQGGGGTDFRPPFQWLDRAGIEPEILIYFTDTMGQYPREAPDYPVIWVVTVPEQYACKAPFGEMVYVEVGA